MVTIEVEIFTILHLQGLMGSYLDVLDPYKQTSLQVPYGMGMGQNLFCVPQHHVVYLPHRSTGRSPGATHSHVFLVDVDARVKEEVSATGFRQAP